MQTRLFRLYSDEGKSKIGPFPARGLSGFFFENVTLSRETLRGSGLGVAPDVRRKTIIRIDANKLAADAEAAQKSLDARRAQFSCIRRR